MIHAIPKEHIESIRQDNIGRLMLRAYRLYIERSLEKLERYGHLRLTISHASILAYIDPEGTHISVLAERLGVTKQAMGQFVAELERRNYVVREIDPTDRRAILVRFTERGAQFIKDAYAVKLEMEAEYSAALGGDENIEQFRTMLKPLQEPMR
jgi:DNA-binding MarR family transcriptional regulator